MNTNFTDIVTWANGNITNNNINASAGIALTKLDLTTEFAISRTTGNRCISAQRSGDTIPRATLMSDGWLAFGPGSASALDMMFYREDGNTLAVRNYANSSYKDLKCAAFTASGATSVGALTAASLSLSSALSVGGGGTGNGSLSTTAGNVPFLDGTKFTTLSSTAGSFIRFANGGAAIEAFAPYYTPGGRLTGTTNVPVTTSDVTGIGTLRYTPFLHNRAWLKRTNWELHTFTEVTLSLSLSSGSVYDVFLYSNSGTPTLETLVWTNTTTRATAITQDSTTNLWVKSGDATRLYVGTIYATASNQTEDSAARRHVFNAYNRVPRRIYATDTTDSWSYASTMHAANGNTTAGVGRVEFTIGSFAADTFVWAAYTTCRVNNGAAAGTGGNGIGLDSTSTAAALTMQVCSASVTDGGSLQSQYSGFPALGFHYIQALEYVTSGTSVFYGDNGGSVPYSYLNGWLMN
jgi:hypothetical protein